VNSWWRVSHDNNHNCYSYSCCSLLAVLKENKEFLVGDDFSFIPTVMMEDGKWNEANSRLSMLFCFRQFVINQRETVESCLLLRLSQSAISVRIKKTRDLYVLWRHYWLTQLRINVGLLLHRFVVSHNPFLTLRRLMSYIYIYGAPFLDVSRSHTTTHHSR